MTLTNSLLNALGCFLIIILPILLGVILQLRSQTRKLRKERELYKSELEKQQYANQYLETKLNDMMNHGNAGRILKHLIETNQL